VAEFQEKGHERKCDFDDDAEIQMPLLQESTEEKIV
jgi:hypothetical protein